MSIASAFAVEGELSIYRAAELTQALNAWVPQAAQTHGCIALHLNGVSDMDCAGLQVLLSVQRSADALGVPFQLRSASTAVLDVLHLTALMHLTVHIPTH